MAITSKDVKVLRDKTGLGMMLCKEALKENDGDVTKAEEWLRKQGHGTSRTHRTTSEGYVGSYIHANGKIGVLCEVNCETDFVAKNEDFRQFAKDLCMHVAAFGTKYLKREEVPAEIVEKEREIYAEQVKGKPENIIDKIVNGKLDKFYSENCLLEQPFVKDDKVTVTELLQSLTTKIGENIQISRFVRFGVGETQTQQEEA